MVDRVHCEAAALPVAFDGLGMTWECVFTFWFLVYILPSTASSVDLNTSLCPCEDLILLSIINHIPLCGVFAIFGSLARRFCQGVVLP